MEPADLELFERSLRHATRQASGDALDAALADLGWYDALTADPATAVAVLFELQGTAGTTSSALDAVLSAALGADAPTAVVLPPLGEVTPPGAGGAIRGLATSGVLKSDRVLVATGANVVDVPTADLELRPVSGLDPDLGLVEVAGSAAPESGAPGAWADAVAAGQLALAHELVGVSRTMLELARQHALERVQFDRPIAGFQAVRHRLAETYVAVEGAAGAAVAAAEEASPFAAAAAKAIAGRAARVAAKHCQQVLAGIGFTTEHDLHRFVRRALVLDRLLGDARSLTRAMGQVLLRDRTMPSLLRLTEGAS